tara:strand:+ start:112 stop:747 length:636 start_codon:yes stop_codon:yes gene_type:complete
MKKLKIVVLTFLVISLCFSQDTNPAGQSISVSIDQSMLNNFFNAIGEVKGKGSTKVLGKKVKYNWKVKNPRITIEPGAAIFKADVQIKSGKIKSTPKATSKLDISYVKEKNLIKIKTKKIKVDLKLNLFGKKVKLATLDLSKYYNPTFEFPGPTLNQKSIEIDKPDGSKKTLNIGMENQNLVVENGKITVYSDVKFSDLTHDEKHPERNKN